MDVRLSQKSGETTRQRACRFPAFPLSPSPRLFLTLLLILCAGRAGAQPAEAVQHFDAGNQHYAQGAYDDALTAYEQALASGYASGALYYNMGNAYYRLDQLGQAIRYYEKARRYLPNDPHLQHNLSIARSRITLPISSIPTPIWVRWWQQYIVHMGAGPFFIAGLLLYLVAAGLAGYRMWTGRRNPWHRRILAASLLVGLLLLAAAFSASLSRTLDRQAVVIADVVPLREAPQPAAPSELDVPEGILVQVLREHDGWLEVRLPNGITGWLRTASTADV